VASGPLDGIRILEFTQIIAGPFGCMMLADQGAEVIKVEPPNGEPWRLFNQFMPGESKTFQELNRGKKSLVLELSDRRAQEAIHKLIPKVDVVVINYRPDVAEKLRIDYPTLSAIRPDLIYVDNTAFGRKGPWAKRPGYDVVVQAVSGLMAAEGKIAPDGRPEWIVSTAIADYATGLAIAWAVTSALYHRERTGEGQLVETTLLATALAFQASVMEHPLADATLRAPARERRRELQGQGASFAELAAVRNPLRAAGGANIYYRTYRTKDGAVAVGALSPTLWAKVRAALETDFLGAADPNANINDPDWVAQARAKVQEVEERVASRTSAEWIEVFDREGVPAGPVQFPEDLSEDPQVLANDMMVDLEHELSGPQKMVAPILRFSKTPTRAQGAAPPLGRDTDTYLREAGLSDEDIAKMRADGVAH
jgi:crotonobetainyl-CoA:carnitine CoA-transferase CaiB-like acyl-CoA transferase